MINFSWCLLLLLLRYCRCCFGRRTRCELLMPCRVFLVKIQQLMVKPTQLSILCFVWLNFFSVGRLSTVCLQLFEWKSFFLFFVYKLVKLIYQIISLLKLDFILKVFFSLNDRQRLISNYTAWIRLKTLTGYCISYWMSFSIITVKNPSTNWSATLSTELLASFPKQSVINGKISSARQIFTS